MILNVRKLVLRRLALAWLLISATLGGLAYYLETERVDDFVLSLALAEADKLTARGAPLLNRHDAASRHSLQAEADALVRDRFIVVELYDRDKRKIVEATNPAFEWIERSLKAGGHNFSPGKAMYEKYWLENELVLQVLLPLIESDGVVQGYFEGVYRVDQPTRDEIRQRIVEVLVITLIGVLATTLLLYPIILSLNRDVLKFSRDLLKGNIELMEVLGGAIAKRDSDTSVHNYRVTIYALRLAETLGVEAVAMRDLIAGAFLHDVGKIGISDGILLKPGRLDAEEFKVMQTHVALGTDILAKSNWLQSARPVVECHHEKFDGSGYPRGLKGEQIPLAARIFAIVDVFDALTSKRPYKEALGRQEALAILRRDAGSHFDPQLVDAFCAIVDALHQEVAAMPDAGVEAMLGKLIERYFFNDSRETPAPVR